ncbi:MAG: dienelactone hydrolase family protein [Alphaproteobacteria bacterium]|nr:dienelactone hydrolase family protein [Alphaproteobacteria bacterium]
MADIKVQSSGGGEFDCHLAVPEGAPGPALIIMPAIWGVDEDIRNTARDCAEKGIVVAAPDLFWRGDSGPMPRTEDGGRRARARAENRAPQIEAGVQDLADVMAVVKGLPQCNGRVAVLGLCYGGPYALLGPARLGCDAGFAFHGTGLEEYLDAVPAIGDRPIRLHWGDQDRVLPPRALAEIREATAGMPNIEITIYPGVGHGYSGASNAKAWNAAAAEDSWKSAFAALDGLRDAPALSA